MTSAEFSHRNAVAPQRLLRISQFHRVHSNCSFEKCIFENTKYKLIKSKISYKTKSLLEQTFATLGSRL